ncbi:MAG TPA: cellulase N-terminal Ig-like domain-containing protein, partial [Puia sp.]|nr:cellulase N-terminal Ig-like domain-containing protein [Puia sp.]
MRSFPVKTGILFFLVCVPCWLLSQIPQIVTDHVGYEDNLSKRAILVSDNNTPPETFQLISAENGQVVFTGKAVFSGPVDKWKNWNFSVLDFSPYTVDGTYSIQLGFQGKNLVSYPFIIGKNVLEQSTISNLLYYFKGQRSSGLLDKADHHLSLEGKSAGGFIDAHGGWYDATGDYGKHLSHLSFSTYFNPQQISFTVWSLLTTYKILIRRPGTDFRQYNRRILDEAMYGADYLTRMQAPNGSFYRSVGAPGPGKLAKDRVIAAESKGYTIKKSKDQSFGPRQKDNDWRSFQASYRSGGGMAIAALALASTFDTTGEYKNSDYLKAAENAFDFLEKNNVSLTNNGKEN